MAATGNSFSDLPISENLLWKRLAKCTQTTKLSIFIEDLPYMLPTKLSVHLAKQFERRFFYIGQSETRIAWGGHVC
jgi:hypothetical protein